MVEVSCFTDKKLPWRGSAILIGRFNAMIPYEVKD